MVRQDAKMVAQQSALGYSALGVVVYLLACSDEANATKLLSAT